jgi:hypothetical protein
MVWERSLKDRAFEFAVAILKLYSKLAAPNRAYAHMALQLFRSASSIGAQLQHPLLKLLPRNVERFHRSDRRLRMLDRTVGCERERSAAGFTKNPSEDPGGGAASASIDVAYPPSPQEVANKIWLAEIILRKSATEISQLGLSSPCFSGVPHHVMQRIITGTAKNVRIVAPEAQIATDRRARIDTVSSVC